MKYVLLFSCLFVLTAGLAQEYKVSAVNTKDGKLVLLDVDTKGFIEGYEGNEILIVMENYISVPDKAKGLKPVFAKGVDNTGIGLQVEKKGTTIHIKGLRERQTARYRIKVPNQLALEVRDITRSDTVFVRNMKNGVDIKTDISIYLRNIQGPILANIYSGNIDLELTKANQSDDPISLISASGDIEVMLPETMGVRFNLVTDGRVYSDLDWNAVLEKKSHEGMLIAQRYIKGQMNGGGLNLKAMSGTGNIYIKKTN